MTSRSILFLLQRFLLASSRDAKRSLTVQEQMIAAVAKLRQICSKQA